MDTRKTDSVGAKEEVEDLCPQEIPGLIAEFGDLGAGTIIQEAALRRLFNRSKDSIARAVDRRELPPPVRLFGQNTWTVGVLVQHLEKRLEQAAKQAERANHKMLELQP